MERLDNGLIIYSITIGDNPNDGVKWSIGQRVKTKNKGEFTISTIFLDEFYHETYQRESYVITAKDSDGNEVLWRRYTNAITSLVYDL